MGFFKRRAETDMDRTLLERERAEKEKSHIAIAANPSSVEVHKYKGTFIIEVKNKNGFSALDNMDSLIDLQTFVIFKNDTDFYIRSIPFDYRFQDLEKYYESGHWKECYVFGDKNIVFPKGVEQIFVNRLLNLLRKYNTGSILNTYCNDGDPSNFLSIVEQNEYEDFWCNIKFIISTIAANMFPVERSSRMLSLNSDSPSLFNVDSALSSSSDIVLKNLTNILSAGGENVMEYTLQDSLGHTVSAFTLHQLFYKWVKELYEIPQYNKLMRSMTIGIYDTYYDRLMFSDRNNKGMMQVAESLYLSFYAKEETGRTYQQDKTVYISSDEIKKRMAILASLCNLRFNIDEKIFIKPSAMMNNSNFAEEVREENKKRDERTAELVERIEEYAKEDFDKFVECSLNSNSENSGEAEEKNVYTAALKNSQALTNEGSEDGTDEEPVDTIDRKAQEQRMMSNLSVLLKPDEDDFKQIFNND